MVMVMVMDGILITGMAATTGTGNTRTIQEDADITIRAQLVVTMEVPPLEAGRTRIFLEVIHLGTEVHLRVPVPTEALRQQEVREALAPLELAQPQVEL